MQNVQIFTTYSHTMLHCVCNEVLTSELQLRIRNFVAHPNFHPSTFCMIPQYLSYILSGSMFLYCPVIACELRPLHNSSRTCAIHQGNCFVDTLNRARLHAITCCQFSSMQANKLLNPKKLLRSLFFFRTLANATFQFYQSD